MKFTTLTTCTLVPIISYNTSTIHASQNQWQRFQQMIHNSNYHNKYEEVDRTWQIVLVEKVDRWEHGGIFISPEYLEKFYEKFKFLLDHINGILLNFDEIKIIGVVENKLDQIYKIHRKNPIDLWGIGPIEMYKRTAKIFPNLEKAWNMTQEIYSQLKQITKNQFQ